MRPTVRAGGRPAARARCRTGTRLERAGPSSGRCPGRPCRLRAGRPGRPGGSRGAPTVADDDAVAAALRGAGRIGRAARRHARSQRRQRLWLRRRHRRGEDREVAVHDLPVRRACKAVGAAVELDVERLLADELDAAVDPQLEAGGLVGQHEVVLGGQVADEQPIGTLGYRVDAPAGSVVDPDREVRPHRGDEGARLGGAAGGQREGEGGKEDPAERRQRRDYDPRSHAPMVAGARPF